MVAVPAATPVTNPVPGLTTAWAVEPEDQRPLNVASVRVIGKSPASHVENVPPMAAGNGLTVTKALR